MERVFRALGDRSRRHLLDALHREDGQTLHQLQAQLDMTRFGVMKHLRVLEEAGLVTTKRIGREKRHYLNPVPIRLVHDRWIAKYAEPWVGAMSHLKRTLEAIPMNAPKHVYEVYIRTTPEALWQAITDPAFTSRFFYNTSVRSTWKTGESIEHVRPDGVIALKGTVLEVDRPRRLVHTFCAVHDPVEAKEKPSRVTWTIQPRGETCLLTLVHDDFPEGSKTAESVRLGWNPVLSGLKTLLETGEPLASGPKM
jgi:uncharacterized protein YndB with AHSA1/START domain/DNA-binding transcriptional ArsR family regulator